MKKIWTPVIIIGLVIFLGVNLYLNIREPAAVVASEVSDFPVGINKGELAPNFEGTTLSGEKITLADLRGKTVLINVFASWCGPCQLEAPHLANVYAELDHDEVVFIGLNLEEKLQNVAYFKEKFAWEFPLVLNEDGALTDQIYTPIGLPTSWFIDPQGVIQYVHVGPITEEMLRQAIVDIQMGRDPHSFGN